MKEKQSMDQGLADRKYAPIFEPITINGCEIKNRIVMSPMNCNYTAPDHYISKQQMAYYAARAKGGTGLIITEAQADTAFQIFAESVTQIEKEAGAG